MVKFYLLVALANIFLLAGAASADEQVHATYSEPADIVLDTMIPGTVFNDRNSNGMQGMEEEPLGGWTIVLSGFDRYTKRPVRKTAKTDSDGGYFFTNLTAGRYMVCEEIKSGWRPTTPVCNYVKLVPGGLISVDFGNTMISSYRKI